MADNTVQYECIVTIKGNLDLLFADNPDVFVAGDLLWYPVEGNPEIRQAPDVMVVFGRPKGHRRSYKQWEERNTPPQVVFEVWSPSNRLSQMLEKLAFYERYGVEEYYLYYPESGEWDGWTRQEGRLQPVAQMDSWQSPRLGIRFAKGREAEV
ncbi:MAG: Uma2 family endonuclease, partial [Armatimonadetes bacterium]|nr:Uma2 family endonuclease [Armatimonadota bacterium]